MHSLRNLSRNNLIPQKIYGQANVKKINSFSSSSEHVKSSLFSHISPASWFFIGAGVTYFSIRYIYGSWKRKDAMRIEKEEKSSRIDSITNNNYKIFEKNKMITDKILSKIQRE